MNEPTRDIVQYLIEENTTESWAEALCIAIAQLKDKEGKLLRVFLSDDIPEHIRLVKQLAKLLRGEK
jgi:hypothetical protein